MVGAGMTVKLTEIGYSGFQAAAFRTGHGVQDCKASYVSNASARNGLCSDRVTMRQLDKDLAAGPCRAEKKIEPSPILK